MKSESENEFIHRARTTLDGGTHSLDEFTIARLRAARLQALEARPQRIGRRTAGWIAAGVTAGLAATLLFHSPALVPPHIDQIEWVAEVELQIAQDPEFYQWLADGKRTI